MDSDGESILQTADSARPAGLPADRCFHRCSLEPAFNLVRASRETFCGACFPHYGWSFLIVVGSVGYIWCARDFAFIGLSFGPPSLVARGIYGFLRHPMYFSLLLVRFGESFLFKSWRLFGYACVCGLVMHTFVILYEEPHMMKKWGSAYLRYCENVPRWIPRTRRLQA